MSGKWFAASIVGGIIALLLAGCAPGAGPTGPSGWPQCRERQDAAACPATHDPVCAILGPDAYEEYENSCLACANPAVHEYAPGPCPERYNACKERRQHCPASDAPVCGKRIIPTACKRAPCEPKVEWVTFKNACVACADTRVEGYRIGSCKDEQLTAEALS